MNKIERIVEKYLSEAGTMKMKPDDYKTIKDAIVKKAKDKDVDIAAFRKKYKEDGLSDTRFAWDLFWFTGLKIGDGKGIKGDLDLYAYMNDTTIGTALFRIVDELTKGKMNESGPDPKKNWVDMASRIVHNDPDFQKLIKPHQKAMDAALKKRKSASDLKSKIEADREAQKHAKEIMDIAYKYGEK